jgi:hypothetical protein
MEKFPHPINIEMKSSDEGVQQMPPKKAHGKTAI